MSEAQYIQWFPGHMTKTRRQMEQDIDLVDAVAEIVDARIPVSSRNPDLPALVGKKPYLVLLNKCDMADPAATAEWIEALSAVGFTALPVDCKSGKGLDQFFKSVQTVCADRLESYRAKGMVGKPLRVMVAGIPNVGKSTLINRLAGKNKAVVENRPGVTRGNQWFSTGRQLELLDTPGVLWPKFADRTIGEHLAFTGAVADHVLDKETLAVRFLELLAQRYPAVLTEKYGIDASATEPYEMLCVLAQRRGMRCRGGEFDTERAAAALLEEYRNGKLGRMTLERVK